MKVQFQLIVLGLFLVNSVLYAMQEVEANPLSIEFNVIVDTIKNFPDTFTILTTIQLKYVNKELNNKYKEIVKDEKVKNKIINACSLVYLNALTNYFYYLADRKKITVFDNIDSYNTAAFLNAYNVAPYVHPTQKITLKTSLGELHTTVIQHMLSVDNYIKMLKDILTPRSTRFVPYNILILQNQKTITNELISLFKRMGNGLNIPIIFSDNYVYTSFKDFYASLETSIKDHGWDLVKVPNTDIYQFQKIVT